MSSPAEGPALVLVATPIGNLGDMSPRAVAALRTADVIAAEDTRRTRNLLTAFEIPRRGRLMAIHEHNEAEMASRVVALVSGGDRVAYVTDAGTPGISDPGARLARAVLEAGLPVEIVPGPTAVISALVLSGFPTERFVFEGFLPRKGKARSARLALLVQEDRPTVLYESPARLGATLADLAAALSPERGVAIARELTKLHEEVWRGTLGECADGPPLAPRGEVVIVLGPAAPAAPVSDDTVLAAIDAELAGGSSARDAAAAAARGLGIPKRRAYEVALRRKGSPPVA